MNTRTATTTTAPTTWITKGWRKGLGDFAVEVEAATATEAFNIVRALPFLADAAFTVTIPA